jgi:NADP-dependent 3-hydroxy acid dehydrogenase YdfG
MMQHKNFLFDPFFKGGFRKFSRQGLFSQICFAIKEIKMDGAKMTSFKNKTVIVTGASRGIGEATARAFANAGANVVLAARDADALEKIAADIGETALACPGNIADPEFAQRLVQTSLNQFGGVDILINNAAALQPIAHMADADVSAWSELIDINVKGVFYAMRAALPQMVHQGDGTILTISSGAAHNPLEGWSAYCASKAAAAMLTLNLHLEYANKGIRAMGLSPGTVATQMQRDIKASGINPISQLEWSDHIPPEWPARAILWMCGAVRDDLAGLEISLRDENIRKKVGLI